MIIIEIKHMFDKEAFKRIVSLLRGEEDITLIFDCPGGNINYAMAIAEILVKAPRTRAICKKAVSAPFFVALYCDERFALNGSKLWAHTGMYNREEIDISYRMVNTIPQEVVDNFRKFTTMLYTRLKDLGMPQQGVEWLSAVGWLKKNAEWWIEYDFFKEISPDEIPVPNDHLKEQARRDVVQLLSNRITAAG